MNHGRRVLIGGLVVVGLAVALVLLAAGGQGAQATDGRLYYVDADAMGADDCTSWADACVQLYKALEMAVAGDQIWVAEGIYKPAWEFSPGDPRSATFQMKNGVAIYGGFDPPIDDTFKERDWEDNVTFLSGDLGLPGYPSDNSYHVFYHPPETGLSDSAILDGFWIIAGVADGSVAPHDNGAGMFNDGVSPVLNNLYFAGDRAQRAGGGIYNVNGASPKLTGCEFGDNWSGEQGGAMANYGSAPTLTECIFEGNRAVRNGGAMFNWESSPTIIAIAFAGNVADDSGGAVYNYLSSPELSDCIFWNNSADSGGGIYNDSSSPTLLSCSFEENSADSGGGIYNGGSSPALTQCDFVDNSANSGGGIFNYASSPELSDCIFWSNLADSDGGGIFNLGSQGTLTGCSFFTNSASRGGGIYSELSDPALANCTFWGNLATSGAGMSVNDASPVLTNCTFWDNSATSGGGIFNDAKSAPIVTNCILWGDTPDEITGGSPVVSYSDIEGGYPGESNIDQDPLFVEPANRNFHLQMGSPCIDVGNNAAPNLPGSDFEGDDRILDGDGNVIAVVDMGVDEVAFDWPYHRQYLPLVLSNY